MTHIRLFLHDETVILGRYFCQLSVHVPQQDIILLLAKKKTTKKTHTPKKKQALDTNYLFKGTLHQARGPFSNVSEEKSEEKNVADEHKRKHAANVRCLLWEEQGDVVDKRCRPHKDCHSCVS